VRKVQIISNISEKFSNFPDFSRFSLTFPVVDTLLIVLVLRTDDAVRGRLLRKREPKLDQAANIIRAAEQTAKQMRVIQKGEGNPDSIEVNEVKKRGAYEFKRQNNLKLNQNKEYPEKLQYRKVKYLGHTVAGGQIKPDPEYVESIKDMRKKPSSKDDIRRVLGMINFVSKFIPNYSRITAPIRKLLYKDVLFERQVEQQEVFDKLKDGISNGTSNI